MRLRLMQAALCAACVTLSASVAIAAPRLVLSNAPVKPKAPNPEARAREVLDVRAPESRWLELSPVLTRKFPTGRTLVRFRQQHAGTIVLDRGASVLLDASGNATPFAAARLEQQFPLSTTPALASMQAALSAERVFRGARFSDRDAKLAWLPGPGGARLVWLLYRGLIPGTPRAPMVLVDASSGVVVGVRDETRFDRAATVFELNPVKSPTESDVTLATLDPGATLLADQRIESLTCIDTHQLEGKQGIHFCELQPHASADAQGDFPYSYQSDTDPEDAFAEVSMYYHANKMYAFLESLGMPELSLAPLTTVANLRFPAGWDVFDVSQMKNPNLELQPYNNAFFTPENPYGSLFAGVHGGLFFGQGDNADFAYDGDVVYHEFGHAMVDRTISLVASWHLDEQGASDQPGAMNEGLADYFSSALAGDSQVGEYAAKNLGYGNGGGFIRDLNNKDTCPKNISGEVHADSTLFSGALWSVRQSLPEADRPSYDAALLMALVGAPTGDVSYDDVADLFLASLEASPLGTAGKSALETEMQNRGVLPSCPRVFEYTGNGIHAPSGSFNGGFFAPGRPYLNFDSSIAYAPGLIQVHAKLAAGSEQIRIRWQAFDLPPQYQLGGPDTVPYTSAALVQFGSDPITFSYGVTGPMTDADGPYPASYGATEYIDVPAGASEVWAMIVDQGDDPGLYSSIKIETKSASSGGTGGSGGISASGGAPGVGGNALTRGGAAPTNDAELTPAGGCGCATPRGSTRNFAWLALALLGLAARRRR
jgi:MYXO-CTERM domain-containing protein